MIDFCAYLFLVLLSYFLGFCIGSMNEISNILDVVRKIEDMPYPEFKRYIQKLYG